MFRIRIHGRGGQGVKTASRILGSALFLSGYEVQDAPRYGAERRGAPIFAYVRASHAPILERGVITVPDLVVVADETLVPFPAAGVLQGIGDHTVLLLDSRIDAARWRDRLKLTGPILTLPAGECGGDAVARPLTGTRCAGAAARLLGVIAWDTLEAALHEEVGGLGARSLAANLQCARAAFDAMAAHEGIVSEGRAIGAAGYRAPDWIDVPVEDVLLSGPDIRHPSSSALARTGTWRTQRPVIDPEACNRCSWICSTLCPDSAILVDADHRPTVDYEHCKGCMVCVAVCPAHAIRAEREDRDAGAGEPT
ncbi:MAG: hypothetical protein GC151_01775 [Betaproteobacteria bacterium]|nr:hypothetical protein [Betaproteobacteria bacterium]